MKPQKIEKEGPFVDDKGHRHLDTGDLWHLYMPRTFWTADARILFQAATAAGILRWLDEADCFAPGEGITKAQLAYWCKRASTYLGIDRGGTTSWKPFEKVFGTPAGTNLLTGEHYKGSNPLKFTLQNIDYTAQDPEGARKEYLTPIDQFFETLKASTNGE